VRAPDRERLEMSSISVLTPSREYGRYISDAIESARQQEGVTIQHVVQDAGSDDGTLDTLRSYGDAVEWKSEPDRGQSEALNRALGRANGDWIAWLNADEFYLPRGLRTLLDAGEEHGADVVYGDWVTVGDGGRLIALRPQHRFNRTILRLYGPFVASVSVLIRRSSLSSAPWDPSLIQVMDWDAYLSLASRGASFLHVAYPVGAFRLHGSQASTRTKHVRRERAEVQTRYGIPSGRWARRVGLTLHGLAKLAAGSYVRQARATTLRGRDLRWFEGGEGAETFRRLLDRCYGVRTPR
jgi:glycosyltransferase involved in cell wall biosynthesis